MPDTVRWIDTIGVDPEYQHRGIGETLFKSLIDFKRPGKNSAQRQKKARSKE